MYTQHTWKLGIPRNPWMVEHLFDCDPLGRVNSKHPSQEITTFWKNNDVSCVRPHCNSIYIKVLITAPLEVFGGSTNRPLINSEILLKGNLATSIV